MKAEFTTEWYIQEHNRTKSLKCRKEKESKSKHGGPWNESGKKNLQDLNDLEDVIWPH